jgi:hypothetical protein
MSDIRTAAREQQGNTKDCHSPPCAFWVRLNESPQLNQVLVTQVNTEVVHLLILRRCQLFVGRRCRWLQELTEESVRNGRAQGTQTEHSPQQPQPQQQEQEQQTTTATTSTTTTAQQQQNKTKKTAKKNKKKQKQVTRLSFAANCCATWASRRAGRRQIASPHPMPTSAPWSASFRAISSCILLASCMS